MKFPGATWKPVTRYQSGELRQPMTPRRLVLHTAQWGDPTMHAYFNVAGRATPHFFVNAAGKAEQYIDTDFCASACLEGNHNCIAVESWDGHPDWPGDEVPDWTPEQEEWLVELAAWCHQVHGIPVERLPSSAPGEAGIGWHRMGIDGDFPAGLLAGRAAGGEHWSSSGGKVCPGDNKIRGIVERIIPRAQQLVNGDDMPGFEDKIPGTDGKTLGDALRAALQTREALKAFRENLAERDRTAREELLAVIDALPDAATRKDVREVVSRQLDKQKSAEPII